MRRFVVTSPGLSVGTPGNIVTDVELGMDDDLLDEWVEAGYGLEVFDTEPESAPDATDEQPAP